MPTKAQVREALQAALQADQPRIKRLPDAPTPARDKPKTRWTFADLQGVASHTRALPGKPRKLNADKLRSLRAAQRRDRLTNP